MRAFAALLPRLQAEERLAAIDNHAIGGGLLEKYEQSRAIRQLERMAAGGKRPKAARASPATLAAMGIGMIEAAPEPSQKAMNPVSGPGQADG